MWLMIRCEIFFLLVASQKVEGQIDVDDDQVLGLLCVQLVRGEESIDVDYDKVWDVLYLQLVKRGRGQLMWMMIRCEIYYTCS